MSIIFPIQSTLNNGLGIIFIRRNMHQAYSVHFLLISFRQSPTFCDSMCSLLIHFQLTAIGPVVRSNDMFVHVDYSYPPLSTRKRMRAREGNVPVCIEY